MLVDIVIKLSTPKLNWSEMGHRNHQTYPRNTIVLAFMITYTVLRKGVAKNIMVMKFWAYDVPILMKIEPKQAW